MSDIDGLTDEEFKARLVAVSSATRVETLLPTTRAVILLSTIATCVCRVLIQAFPLFKNMGNKE